MVPRQLFGIELGQPRRPEDEGLLRALSRTSGLERTLGLYAERLGVSIDGIA